MAESQNILEDITIPLRKFLDEQLSNVEGDNNDEERRLFFNSKANKLLKIEKAVFKIYRDNDAEIEEKLEAIKKNKHRINEIKGYLDRLKKAYEEESINKSFSQSDKLQSTIEGLIND